MDADNSAEDFPEGTESFSTSPGPGDLAALAAHPSPNDDEDSLDEFPVPAKGQTPGVTSLVVGDPEAKRRAQAAEWSEE